jgi:hypothetical protein
MVIDVVFFGPVFLCSLREQAPTSVEPIQHAPGAYFFLLTFQNKFFPRNHGRINYIDTKAKCRHVKN